jgi:replicative DNA helicase
MENEEIIVSKETKEEVKVFDFNDQFQAKIAKSILVDIKFAQQIYEVLDVEYFKPRWIKAIIGEHKSFFLKYGTFPSFDVLTQIISEKYLKNEKTKTLAPLIRTFLESNDEVDLNELKYVKEQALEFCRKAEMQKALISAVDMLAINNDQARYERIHKIITKATMSGSDNTMGLSPETERDIDARYNQQARSTIPTGIVELDDRKILNGGLGRGEIGFVVSPSGGGKSHFLTQFGAAAIKSGYNVMHFTFELKEPLVAIRYDSHLTNIPSLECPDKLNLVKQFWEDSNKNKSLGKLRIKFFPTGTPTVNTLRSYLEKLQSAEGFKPDLILVDYAGIMRSTERHESVRHELKYITEELRAFADEYHAALWTALQSNRDGVDADYLDIHNLAESFSQAFIADFILGWSRKLDEKASGVGTGRIIKNRAGFDGINLMMVMDTSRSKIESLVNIDQGIARALDPKTKREMTKDSMRDFVTGMRSPGSRTEL